MSFAGGGSIGSERARGRDVSQKSAQTIATADFKSRRTVGAFLENSRVSGTMEGSIQFKTVVQSRLIPAPSDPLRASCAVTLSPRRAIGKTPVPKTFDMVTP